MAGNAWRSGMMMARAFSILGGGDVFSAPNRASEQGEGPAALGCH